MTNHYRIEGPALISFSGGRTSAFMLHQILDAHDGQLPPDVHVCFANTGKEREETLRFVHECEARWGVRVRWLEWKSRASLAKHSRVPASDRFREVGFDRASRNGEPLKGIFERHGMLPNPMMRFCTVDAKVHVMRDFMVAQGYDRWVNPIGLRADEVRRVAKSQSRNDNGKDRSVSTWPLFHARVTKRDIWRFWLGGNTDPRRPTETLPQGFDLGLYPYEGNCDGCFLKGRDILRHQERERPGYLDWWAERETENAGKTRKPEMAQFRADWSYADLKADVARQPLLIPLDWRDAEYDAECGVSGTDHRIRCGARAAA